MPVTGSPFDLEILQQIDIDAPPEVVFRSITHEYDQIEMNPDDESASFRLKVEPWVGGRYFRDLGDGNGHLWGFVQVIKPPKLLELCGPLFMSIPVWSHVAFRLEETGSGGTTVKVTHRATGPVPDEVKSGADGGWKHFLEKGLKPYAERKHRAE